MLNRLCSGILFAWGITRQLFQAVGSLCRGDSAQAAAHARCVALLVHERLLRLIVAVQKRLCWRRMDRSRVKRILIIKLDRIGDMVNTTPVFDALHALFPGAQVDLVAHPDPLALLSADPRVAERFPHRSWLYHPLPVGLPGLATWLLVLKLLRRRYSLGVYLRGSLPFLLLGLTARLAAAVYRHGEPVTVRYLRALEPLFGPQPRSRTQLFIDRSAARTARQVLDCDGGGAGPRVAIQATSVSVTREWPAERFAALADELRRTFNARVHFFGSPEEQPKLAALAQSASQQHHYHTSLRLPEVAAAVALCDLFIGNDSALAHIAAAVGVPMIVVWGAANLSMSRPDALPDRCIILYEDLPCRHACPELYCVSPQRLECLRRIRVEHVLGAVKQLLAGSVSSNSTLDGTESSQGRIGSPRLKISYEAAVGDGGGAAREVEPARPSSLALLEPPHE